MAEQTLRTGIEMTKFDCLLRLENHSVIFQRQRRIFTDEDTLIICINGIRSANGYSGVKTVCSFPLLIVILVSSWGLILLKDRSRLQPDRQTGRGERKSSLCNLHQILILAVSNFMKKFVNRV